MRKRRLALLAAALLMLPSGCAPKPAEKPDASPQGGYVESACTLPGEAAQILDLAVLPDGTLSLIAGPDRTSGYGPWSVYHSADGGATWTRESSLGEWPLVAAELRPDGGVRLLTIDLGSNTRWDEECDWVYGLVDVSPDGAKQNETPFTLTGTNLVAETLRTAQNGDVFVNTYRGLYQLDGGTLAVRRRHEAQMGELSFCTFADKLVTAGPDAIESFDVGSGDMLERIQLETVDEGFYASGAMQSHGRLRLVTASPDGQRLFWADRAGLMARAAGGSLDETVMSGAATSLNLPTRMPLRLASLEDGSFLLLYEEGEGYHLARYTWDTAASAEKTVLGVYVLDNFHDGRLRQATGEFQIAHPDAQVNYTVGIPFGGEGMESSVSPRDALRTLTTELLAGNGPDVLVLDDLPVRSYVEKGVLLDLTERAQRGMESGELVGPVVDHYREADGKIYGIPASFSIPMLLGEPEDVAQLHNLSDLADWVEREYHENPQVRPMERLQAGYTEGLFHLMGRQEWYRDGEVDVESLRRHMEAVKRMADLGLDEDIRMRNDLDAGAWYKGVTALAVGSLGMVYDLDVITSLLAQGERQGELRLFPEGGYYETGTVLGVNANSTKRELALAYLDTVLSPAVQQYEYYDGMPVNLTVLRGQFRSESIMYTGRGLIVEGMGDVRFEVEAVWPDAQAEERFFAFVDELRVPLRPDAVLDTIYWNNVTPYYEGTADMDSCIEALREQFTLRAAE